MGNGHIRIDRLQVENFKSFDKLDISFNNLNVIIGANMAGKTNLIRVFGFLSDVYEHGLSKAISLQGGNRLLTNMTLPSQRLSIEITVSFSAQPLRIIKEPKNFQVEKMSYGFELELAGSNHEIVSEKMVFSNKRDAPSADIHIVRSDTAKFRINLPPNHTAYKSVDYLLYNNEDHKPLLLENKMLNRLLPYNFDGFFKELHAYDFEPKLSKIPTLMREVSELKKDGSNLGNSLEKILAEPSFKLMLLNLITDILPSINDIKTEKDANKYIHFKLSEGNQKIDDLPSGFISDGTISIMSTIIALYLQENSIIMIEEPERSIHPSLINRLIDMMYDVARNNQVIITTHNPEVVRHTDIENLYLVSRNERGISKITKPSEINDVKMFLENDVGVDQLYVQNLLA